MFRDGADRGRKRRKKGGSVPCDTEGRVGGGEGKDAAAKDVMVALKTNREQRQKSPHQWTA